MDGISSFSLEGLAADTLVDLAPVHFISHGTSFMLGEDTKVKEYWKKLGKDAIKHGCKGIIIMVQSF